MATNFEVKRAEKVRDFLNKFPNEGSAPLARAIFKKYPKMFDNVEQVRYMIRYRRGATGAENVKTLKDKSQMRPKNFVKPNPFNIPESSWILPASLDLSLTLMQGTQNLNLTLPEPFSFHCENTSLPKKSFG